MPSGIIIAWMGIDNKIHTQSIAIQYPEWSDKTASMKQTIVHAKTALLLCQLNAMETDSGIKFTPIITIGLTRAEAKQALMKELEQSNDSSRPLVVAGKTEAYQKGEYMERRVMKLVDEDISKVYPNDIPEAAEYGQIIHDAHRAGELDISYKDFEESREWSEKAWEGMYNLMAACIARGMRLQREEEARKEKESNDR